MNKVVRLLLLGLGQAATVTAAVLAGQFVALENGALLGREGAVLGILFAAGAAALLMVPLLGNLVAFTSRQAALRASSMYLVLATLPFLFLQDYWLLWWALVSLGLAWALPLRAALVRTAAAEMQISATRLLTLGIFYSLAGAFAGWVIGYALWRLEGPGLPLPVGYVLGLFALALAATLVPPWAGDRPAPITFSPSSWSATARGLLRVNAFRWSLWVGGLVRGGFIALVAWLLLTPATGPVALGGLQAVTLILFGLALSALITSIQTNSRRILGFLPPAATALAVLLFFQAASDDPVSYLPALGWAAGFLLPPLHNALFLELKEGEHLPAEVLRRGTDALFAGLIGLALAALTTRAGLSVATVLLGLAFLVSAAALLAWHFARREFVELILDGVSAPIYRIDATGPGLDQLPPRGPALILANHACWFDPIFLGKVLPRKIVPMMTSLFFDLPLMRWIVVHLARAIRVEAATFRREVPELAEAVATLDQGEVLVVFPEGAMRRREDQWLRNFGQGVVHILRERPDTPIFTCWIEGNWGSFFSYCNGPPTKNKRMDFWRAIRIAVAEPLRIDPELLEDHRAARQFLMRAVLETRGLLGLEVLPMPALAGRPEEVEA